MLIDFRKTVMMKKVKVFLNFNESIMENFAKTGLLINFRVLS